MSEVKKWLTETFDVDLAHLDICTVEERGGRGVKALTTIPTGEYIIKLPLNVLITRKGIIYHTNRDYTRQVLLRVTFVYTFRIHINDDQKCLRFPVILPKLIFGGKLVSKIFQHKLFFDEKKFSTKKSVSSYLI